MKNLAVCATLLVVLSLAACVTVLNTITFENDTYKNTKTFLLRHSYSKIKGKGNGVSYFECTYVREVPPGGAETISAYLYARKSTSSFDLKADGFLKINEQVFPLHLEKRESAQRSETSSKTETQTTTDSTGIHTTQVDAGTSTEEWKEDRAFFRFTPEQIAALKLAYQVEFRLYTGPYPVTFSPNTKELAKLKELLTRPLPN